MTVAHITTDMLYDNIDDRLEFTGNGNFDVLWPGNGKPGLWMNLMSRMAGVYTLLAREEAIFMAERSGHRHENGELAGDEDIELVIPPIFERCTKILDANEQMMARDLYWEVVNDDGSKKEKGEEMLLKCIEKNGTTCVVEPVLYEQRRVKERLTRV
ncbi:hypothetical protein L6452_20639 [Arctium lappa]|uniref:Uncharacterized protein n=1 Tax=Arctium lappa TaxID=4217 RepID=A0ACB9BBY4_ARCLA|nr:hypothetical protein L6452_20639 [Arctium lappa]